MLSSRCDFSDGTFSSPLAQQIDLPRPLRKTFEKKVVWVKIKITVRCSMILGRSWELMQTHSHLQMGCSSTDLSSGFSWPIRVHRPNLAWLGAKWRIQIRRQQSMGHWWKEGVLMTDLTLDSPPSVDPIPTFNILMESVVLGVIQVAEGEEMSSSCSRGGLD